MRGVTFVTSVLCDLAGVVLCETPLATLDRTEVETELGVSFESGREPEAMSLGVSLSSSSGRFGGSLVVVYVAVELASLLATDLTELAEELNTDWSSRSRSRFDGVTLRFIVLRLRTLARKETESASGSTLLRVARKPAREGRPLGGVVVDGELLIRSSTDTSISRTGCQ